MRIRRISGLMPPAVVHPVEWYAPERPIGVQPLPEPPPPDNTDWEGYAQRRKVEGDLQGAARQAQLQPEITADPIQQMLAAARRAGLTQSEVMKLRGHLTAILPNVLVEDLKFLKVTILRSAHRLQGFRSFLEMVQLAESEPGRVRRDVALTLVRAVSVNATVKSRKNPASMKSSEASRAARALAGMTLEDYFHAIRMLEKVEEETDRVSILKAIASRHDSLVNPVIQDTFRNMAGLPSYFLSEVEAQSVETLSKTGEVNPDSIGRTSLQEVQPKEYLQGGFFTPEGELRSGIYGFCSAAMARRCQEEGTEPETLRELVDVVSSVGEEMLEATGEDPELPLDESTASTLNAMKEMTGDSQVLRDLLTAAGPWVVQFRDLAAFAVHLERILRHMEA